MNKEQHKKMLEAKKEKYKDFGLFFENEFYTITKIPLNYKIDIKTSMYPKIHNHKIDRDCYSDLDKGIDEAHQVAKFIIEKHFRTETKKGFSPGFYRQGKAKMS